MPLKNYTSKIPASRSISYIESKLAQNGARQILKTYDDDGKVTGMCFTIPINGHDMPFKLPARVDRCETVLMQATTSRTRPETLKKIPKQAERTAWKILSDWVEAQMAMIELAQIEVMEVFMPYLYDGKSGQTYYEIMKDQQFKALPGGFE